MGNGTEPLNAPNLLEVLLRNLFLITSFSPLTEKCRLVPAPGATAEATADQSRSHVIAVRRGENLGTGIRIFYSFSIML